SIARRTWSSSGDCPCGRIPPRRRRPRAPRRREPLRRSRSPDATIERTLFMITTSTIGRRIVRAGLLGLGLAAVGVVSVSAQPTRPLSVPAPGSPATQQIPALRNSGIDQARLDTPVPLDLPFVDEAG